MNEPSSGKSIVRVQELRARGARAARPASDWSVLHVTPISSKSSTQPLSRDRGCGNGYGGGAPASEGDVNRCRS